MSIRVLHGDCRDVLRTLEDESVHCIVTSPPYYNLRAYLPDGHPDKSKELGTETTPDAYVAELVGVFRECRRVMRHDGVAWINLGDSFGPGKQLQGIPWKVAFALQTDGWILRMDCVWSKTSCMPESVRDRPTRSHEYLFLLSKSERYYYDAEAIKEDGTVPAGTLGAKGSAERSSMPGVNSRPPEYKVYDGTRNKRSVWTVATAPYAGAHFATFPPALIEPCIKAGTSEKGCCAKCGAPWKRNTEYGRVMSTGGSDKGARAQNLSTVSPRGETNPSSSYVTGNMVQREKITTGWSSSCSCNAAVIPCLVLDPFGGAGTTALVADRLQRSAIIIELNPAYARMAEKRLAADGGMFTEIEAA